ncbi:MAG: helix-turn-helix transcriptional regulator [Betaproteobacteria bacterium]|nr:helix-turn-helix transcriptional regulator [Betaproteobacteria bacterium]
MSIADMLPTANLHDLGALLKAERRAQGLSQAQLATRCGLRRETIIKAERGGNVDAMTLLAIISGLGKTLALKEIGRPVYEDLEDLFNDG